MAYFCCNFFERVKKSETTEFAEVVKKKKKKFRKTTHCGVHGLVVEGLVGEKELVEKDDLQQPINNF